MRKNLLLFLPVLALAAGAVLFTSCGGDDDAAPAPTASFTYEADGRDVAFTSTSTNAKTYAWDFGDGKTSTEANPTHTYDVYGKYTVKLAVVGDGGNATSLPDELTLAKSSAVKIDGSFTEWADIPVSIASTDEASGTITKIKTDYDANNVYFYIEGTADLRGFFDVYFNTDGDTLTGYYSNWYTGGYGADYFAEAYFATDKNGPVWKWNKDVAATRDDWNGWGGADKPVWKAEDKVNESSELKDVGSGKGIEISFKRVSFTDLAAAGFYYAFVDVDEGWSPQGTLPIAHTGTKLQFIDLTK